MQDEIKRRGIKYPLTSIWSCDIIIFTNDNYSKIKAQLEAHSLLS